MEKWLVIGDSRLLEPLPKPVASTRCFRQHRPMNYRFSVLTTKEDDRALISN
jgi:hypothetical protein